jgi:hypothetical protein
MDENVHFDGAGIAQPAADGTACGFCETPLRGEYFQAMDKVMCEPCAERLRDVDAGRGSAIGRFSKAIVLGSGAAAVGAGVYGAVMIWADSEWALISIAIGWLVGKAVRMGSGGRGGWRYQVLAAFLAYSSICAAYGWTILQTADVVSPELIVGIVLLAFRIPFLGASENLIGLLIIAFGVWQAWQMNHRARLAVTGPHALGPAPAPLA